MKTRVLARVFLHGVEKYTCIFCNGSKSITTDSHQAVEIFLLVDKIVVVTRFSLCPPFLLL